MQAERPDAEITEHPRTRHDEHVDVSQYPDRSGASVKFHRSRYNKPAQPPHCRSVSLGSAALQHFFDFKRRDVVVRSRLSRAGADAADFGTRNVLAHIPEHGVQGAFIAKVTAAEIPKQADPKRADLRAHV